MPIPLRHPPADERLEKLLKAAENPRPGTPAVVSCPAPAKDAEQRPKAKKKPLRVLSWHLFELGGGFHMPSVRPQYVIDACARLIKSLAPQVVVLQGLVRTIQEIPASKGSGKATYVAFEEAPQDTGLAEARRILAKLQVLDPAAGWKLELPKVRGTDEILYHRFTTVGFLYASARGLNLQRIELIATATNEAAGITGTLAAAVFDAPDYQSHPLRVMTSLGLATPERPWERLRVPTPPDERAPTAGMPDSALLFVSAPGDASQGLLDLQDAVDAQFLRPGLEGSVLADAFWKVTAESRDGLLGNFAAVNSGNVQLQDQQMHWEALKQPEHSKTADRLPGTLCDGMAVLHHRSTPPPKVQELRIADLIAASLPTAAIKQLNATPVAKTADGKPPPEIAALVAERRTYRAQAVGGPEPRKSAENELAECSCFSRMLSRHWPLVAQILLEAE